MNSPPPGVCRKEGCTVAQDGRCLEGFTDQLQQCPNYSIGTTAPAAPVQDTAEVSIGHVPDDAIDLPLGDDYDSASAGEITRSSVARVIVLAAPVKSGKTTLVTSIYEAFLRGPLDRFLFAGSHTLLGFERRCHEAMEDSGREEEDTERTSAATGLRYLHLRVRNHDLTQPPQDMLFLDASGEFFEQAAASIDECKRLTVIKRCDHFVVLVDGAKISDPATRHGIAIWTRSLLRSCLDAGMLGTHSYVDVLVSKWDVVQLSQHREDSERFVADLEQRLREFLEPRLGRFRFERVSSRPLRKSGLPALYNLNSIILSWIEESPHVVPSRPLDVPKLASEFDRYLLRRGDNVLRDAGFRQT